MASGRVLVVEDDKSVRDRRGPGAPFEGYDVHTAVDGNEALMAVLEIAARRDRARRADARTDGLAVCRKLRERGDRTPVLMLTARHEVTDRVAGLDAGADDYLVKPFALDELLARLRALLRRTSMSGDDEVLRVGDLSLDPARRQAWRGDRELELTKTEFDLLELLLFNAGIVVTRDRSTSASGATSSRRRRSRSTCTSATCAARPRRRRAAPHPHGAGSRLHRRGMTVAA